MNKLNGQWALWAVLGAALALTACGTGSSLESGGAESSPRPDTVGSLPGGGSENAAGLALPQDSRKPWEKLDAQGYVIPASGSEWLNAPAGGGRSASAINAQSDFVAGAQFDSSQGAVAIEGLAAQFSAPAGGRADAVYRIPMQGIQPGAASVDVNLHLNSSSGQLSQCWVGVAEWGKRAWEWKLAPEGQTRFSLAPRVAQGADYINDLGNLMIAVVAFDGARFDLVGLGVNEIGPADTTAPAAPSGLSASPVAGGLELQWIPVIAADLAGYRVYYSNSTFGSTAAPNVKQVPYLQGGSRHLLAPLTQTTVVRVTAVDLSGNESPLSEIASATPLPGSRPVLEVSTSIASGTFGAPATLTASGATLYDIDADGDGIFEITGDAAGIATIDTNQTGIIRPAVRASDGSAVAHGAVSLIIAANLPPVALLDASDNLVALWGDSPATVNLDASGSSDEDAGSLQFAFDGDGNGSFGADSAADNLDFDYFNRGSYLASVRVTDSAGLVGYASALVEARAFNGFEYKFLTTESSSANYMSTAFISGAPSMAMFNTNDGGQLFYARARDAEGLQWRTAFGIDLGMNTGQYPSLAEIKGNPAVAYYDSMNSSLKYIRANSSSGSLQSSWSNPPVPIVTMLNVATNTIILREVNGQPAIVYVNSGDSKLYYVRATGASGTGNLAGDWTMTPVELDTNAVSNGFGFEVVDGNPAVAYYKNSDAMYKRSIDSDGNLPADWSQVPFAVNGLDDVLPDNVSLAVVNGNPAVAYIDPSVPVVRYVRASNSTGATIADWPASVALPELQSPIFTHLAVVDGRPAIVTYSSIYGGSTQPVFIRARDADGNGWDRWMGVTPDNSPSFNFYRPVIVSGPASFGIASPSSSSIPIYFPADFK
ncbi:fibronectin type III domain-containing protein [bacterium]|nr:fibronectin type III domain-containing protein [bacterium]